MDNKDLITRFAEDGFRFEALHQEVDSLIAEADSEVLAYEYEDLANQAAEIVLKLSANGNNVGENFYRYYVERLEYIIDYFRALLDYEETPLAEDEPNELDDEPAAEVGFEGFPAGCVFPPPPPFVYKKWELQFPPMTKDEANAATDEAGAVEEDDSEDEPSDEVDNENDAPAAESDEAARDTAAGAPISETDISLPPDAEPALPALYSGLDGLSSEDRTRVRETFSMWYEMNGVTERNREDGDTLTAAAILKGNEFIFNELKFDMELGDEDVILIDEERLRKTINEAIDAIPDFRDSEKFKELIELYPTYNEIEEL
jgi:hypothetical protein|nr:MAG TPA: hypothetical protein [Caudoviricetes sp.]